jgi:hypothetical protein
MCLHALVVEFVALVVQLGDISKWSTLNKQFASL